jgi:hypothetical protein
VQRIDRSYSHDAINREEDLRLQISLDSSTIDALLNQLRSISAQLHDLLDTLVSMVSLHVAISKLLAFSLILGINSTSSVSHQLADQVNDGAAANPLLSSVSSKGVPERSYAIAEFSSQAVLDGYVIDSYYRSDRGVVFCGGSLIYANAYKLNACKAVSTYYYDHSSEMVVANSTKITKMTYKDVKCQNLLRSTVTAYTAGVCVTGGDQMSLVTSVSTKMSTDLTAARVTRV